MDTRHSQYVLISKRVEEANQKIDSLISQLGWTREEIKAWAQEQKKMTLCPYSQHRVPAHKYNEHSKRCYLKTQGIIYKPNKKSLPSSLFFYQDAPSVVSFVTEEDSSTDPCQEYDRIVSASRVLRSNKKMDDMGPIVIEKQKEKKKKEDKKRRKHRLKMKIVTATDIQRELINAYMEEYRQCHGLSS
ncbi:hypothetical protein BDB01DRAFT_810043 [Pilobolus umbonatus]|nr:hypothetical protein BDB01DRAFT_810043 [Pilobolus umbonatus]